MCIGMCSYLHTCVCVYVYVCVCIHDNDAQHGIQCIHVQSVSINANRYACVYTIYARKLFTVSCKVFQY